jgi:MipA family protein
MNQHKRMRIQVVGSLGCVACMMFSAARAEEPRNAADETRSTRENLKIYVGGGVIHSPDYDGSDDYETDFMPRFAVTFRDVVFLRGPTLGIDVMGLSGSRLGEDLSLGAFVGYDMGRDDEHPILRRLGKIESGLEAGLFVEYATGPLSFEVNARQDIDDRHDGLLVELAAGYGRALSPRWSGQIEATATWADDAYTQAWFGVTPGQSLASGLRSFEASGGIKDTGLSLSLNYRLSRRWTISGLVAHRVLRGDAATSPLVADEGSKRQSVAAVFVGCEL